MWCNQSFFCEAHRCIHFAPTNNSSDQSQTPPGLQNILIAAALIGVCVAIGWVLNGIEGGAVFTRLCIVIAAVVLIVAVAPKRKT